VLSRVPVAVPKIGIRFVFGSLRNVLGKKDPSSSSSWVQNQAALVGFTWSVVDLPLCWPLS